MAGSTILVLLMTALTAVVVAAAGLGRECAIVNEAGIYVFGDSTADDGNNNLLPQFAPKSNFPPYGIDFPGGVATGRFCNGFVAVDFIAKGLCYKIGPPPFASVSNGTPTSRGVNFASGGSGILDSTGMDVISMDEQIKNFEVVKEKITAVMGKDMAEVSLAKSIFVFSTASNDLFAAFIINNPTNDIQRDQIIIPIIDKFKHQLSSHCKTLYELGARKFAVSGTGLLGCIPAMRRTVLSADCDESLNALSMRFKNATKVLLDELSSTLDGFRYSFGDSYEMGLLINDKPDRFGLKELKAACCGSGRLNAESVCSANSTVCSDRRQYYFWDMIHPTQAAYKAVAKLFLHGSPPFCSPVNIRELVLE